MARAATRLLATTRRLFDEAQSESPDHILLARFARSRDEHAFGELVERHGPLVHATCLRLLQDKSTADDVFQATFLVLARKAGNAGWRNSVGPWLHAVAVRLARKARSRRRVESLDANSINAIAATDSDPSTPLAWSEVKCALDEEVATLPTRLSEPLVLCYLQGQTRDEVASLLGISLAMLKRRLERGRNLLRDRLTRRGITLAAAGWGIALTSAPLSAETRAHVVRLVCANRGTVSASLNDLAASFSETSTSRWLVASAVLALGLGLSVLAFTSRPGDPPPDSPASKSNGDEPKKVARSPDAPQDPLPAGAVARFGSRRLVDFTIAKSATFSPDGKLFATSGQNSPLCVWDSATGKLVRTHANLGSVHDLRWRADGVLAAVTFFGHDVFLMQSFGEGKDIDTNDPALAAEHQAMNANPDRDRVYQVLLSGDGKWAIAVMQSRDGKKRWIDRFAFASYKSSATAKPEKTIPVPFGYGIWSSFDGNTVMVHHNAEGKGPDRLLAFDFTAEKPEQPAWVRELPAGEGHRPEECLTIDGKHVIVLSWNDTVELWDGPAGKRIRELPKLPKYYHDGNRESRGIDLSQDGKRIAMVFRDESREVTGRVVDVESGKELSRFAPQPLPRFGGVARFSADGKRVAQVAYGVARIWNAETGEDAVPTPGHCGPVMSLIATADGKTVVSSGDDLTVRGWDPSTGKEAWRTMFSQAVWVRFATPHGIIVQDNLFGTNAHGSLLDAKTGKHQPMPGALGKAESKPRIEGMGRPVADTILAISPDGKSIVTLALHESSFRIWSWPDGALKTTINNTPPEKLELGYCFAAHFTPDGKQFVAAVQHRSNTGQFDMRRRVEPAFVERWDLSSGKMLARTQTGTDHSPPKLIPYADGVLILGDGPDVRDAITGSTAVKLVVPKGQADDFHWANSAALSPDGRVLAVGGGWSNQVWLFEMLTGRVRQILVPEGRYRNALQFLPNGQLVTGGDTALVWSIRLTAVTESTEDLADLWSKLAENDPAKAWPAMAKLAGRGSHAIEFIRARVAVVPKIKDGVIDGIVKRLDAAGFNEREVASAELDRLGRSAVPAIRSHIKPGVPEEVRTRLERFLARHDRPELQPAELQALRAIEVLEAIGNGDAMKALQAYAAGEPGARISREAAIAFRRLNVR